MYKSEVIVLIRTEKRKPDLTQGPLLSKIILFSIPLVLSGILQLLFNTADVIVVGRWGDTATASASTGLAAVGACGSLTGLLVNLFIGLSVGAGVCVAHGIGARDKERVHRTVHTAVLVSLIGGVLVTVLGILLARPLLTLMNTPEAVLNQAVPYMRAYFLGMPASMVYNYCAAMLRSEGDTSRPLVFLSIAGVVNVGLNLIMVLVFHLGALGVGIATAASQWVSAVLILRYMTRYDGCCHISIKQLHIDRQVLKKILSIGIPAGLQSSLFALANVVIQSSINSLGETVMAGNAAASNLDSYIYIAQNALYHAAMTFVGQNVGAQKPTRIKKTILYCSAVVALVGIVLGGAVLLLGKPLLGLYVSSNSLDRDAVLSAGMVRLTIIVSSYSLCGIMDVANGALRGFGRSISPMLITLTGACLLRIVWIATVFRAIPEQYIIYLSYPISWILTSVVLFVLLFFTYRAFKKMTSDVE